MVAVRPTTPQEYIGLGLFILIIMIKLTIELLHSASTSSGKNGFSKNQILALGLDWPPKAGWLKRMAGKEVTEETWNNFLSERNLFIKKREAKREADRMNSEELRANLVPNIYYKDNANTNKKALSDLGFLSNKARSVMIDKARYGELRRGTYDEYLKSEEWKTRRNIHLDFAGNRCQVCNSNQKPLNVHHRTYKNIYKEHANDLIVLCDRCHAAFHKIICEKPATPSSANSNLCHP